MSDPGQPAPAPSPEYDPAPSSQPEMEPGATPLEVPDGDGLGGDDDDTGRPHD